MRRLRSFVANLPLKWRLTLLTSLLLCFFLLFSNTVQYLIINQRLTEQEQSSIQTTITEIKNYLVERKPGWSPNEKNAIQAYLVSINQKNQLIRIVDGNSAVLAAASNHLPVDWVPPQSVDHDQTKNELHHGEHLILMRSPIHIDSWIGTIEIVRNTEDFGRIDDAILAAMIAGALGAIVISGFGAMYLVRQLVKPIQSITDTMRKIKHQGLHERVTVLHQGDEISDLSNMFNDMMDEVETSFLKQKQFVEDASHELRTPVAIIEGHLSLLHRWGKSDPAIVEDSLNASLQEINRLKSLVEELLALTRTESIGINPKPAPIIPAEMMQAAIHRFAAVHPAYQFENDFDGMEQASLEMDANHLEQILLIVLDNAVKYSPEHTKIWIKARRSKGNMIIQIIDQGVGIPPEDLPYIFRRFYRVDKARSRDQGGNGLGLSIAKRLVENYKGTITVTSEMSQGTIVTITLPLQT
jgi:two-component system sensor histidine kinase ArlS